MKKLLLIMAFLLPGFDMQTSSACGCGGKYYSSFEEYVGHPADKVLDGYNFFDAYISLLSELPDIQFSITLLSSPNNYFPKIEQVRKTVVARVQHCALSTVSEGCKVIGVLTYNVREKIFLGCVSNGKLKTYFIVAGNDALTLPLEEAYAPALCGSNTQTAEQILTELRSIKFPDLPYDLDEYAD